MKSTDAVLSQVIALCKLALSQAPEEEAVEEKAEKKPKGKKPNPFAAKKKPVAVEPEDEE